MCRKISTKGVKSFALDVNPKKKKKKSFALALATK